MKYAVLFAVLACAQGETLHYTINWQSGLSLGEATLSSNELLFGSGPNASVKSWNFDLKIDAGVPGFDVRDHYTSTADKDLCSIKLDKTIEHGSHHGEEIVTFDQEHHQVTRQTLPEDIGGKSEIPAPSCAKGAMAYIQFARKQLAEGRLAAQQPVFLGGEYNVRLEFAGTETVKDLGKPVEADKIHATIKGPASEFGVDIFFTKDAARTPVLARIPLSLGVFSVELAP